MKYLRLVLAVCMIHALMLPAFAQKQTPPEGSAPKDFKLPAKKTFELDNGLQATLVPYGSVPKVAVRVAVRAGNLNEGETEVWLADLVGDMMKEGTKTRSAEQVAQDVAGMGGSINIGVGPDETSISSDVLSEFAPQLLELLADVVQNPALPESELERLKKDMLRNLSIQKSQPQSIGLEKFREVLYGAHPYGRIFPSEEMVQGFSIEGVRTFYQNNFAAARTHVYVAGRFDESKVESAIRKGFANMPKGGDPIVNVPKPTSQRAVYVIDRPDAAQSTIYLGLPVIDPSQDDYVPLLVTNSLLGGSFGSRITSNIRENKGYTYSPSSQVSTRYRDAYWVEVADVTTDVTGPSLREIFYEINRLQDEPPPAPELQGIQNYMAGTFVLQNSTRGGIIGQLSFVNLHGLSDSYLTEYVQRVHGVTPEQVQNLTRTYIRDEDMTIVVAGDQKKILGQVANYGRVVSRQ